MEKNSFNCSMNGKMSEFEYSLTPQNGKPPFDFEKEQPPAVTEKVLRQELERRTLIRQIRALRLSAVLMALCMALFSIFIFIAHDSMLIAVICIAVLCVSMIGCAVISILFYRNGLGSAEI